MRKLPPELYRPLVMGPAQEYVRAWLAGRVTETPKTHAHEFVEAAWRAVRGDAEESP